MLTTQENNELKFYEVLLIVRYDKDGQVIAVGNSCHDLARILKITPQAVSHGIHRGSKLYAVIKETEEEQE